MKQESLDRLIEIGGTDLALKVIQLFFQHVPERVSSLKEGLKKGDADTVMRMAHSMKSSAANLGLEKLRNLAQNIESLANKGLTNDCIPLIESLDETVESALEILYETQKKLEC